MTPLYVTIDGSDSHWEQVFHNLEKQGYQFWFNDYSQQYWKGPNFDAGQTKDYAVIYS